MLPVPGAGLLYSFTLLRAGTPDHWKMVRVLIVYPMINIECFILHIDNMHNTQYDACLCYPPSLPGSSALLCSDLGLIQTTGDSSVVHSIYPFLPFQCHAIHLILHILHTIGTLASTILHGIVH